MTKPTEEKEMGPTKEFWDGLGSGLSVGLPVFCWFAGIALIAWVTR